MLKRVQSGADTPLAVKLLAIGLSPDPASIVAGYVMPSADVEPHCLRFGHCECGDCSDRLFGYSLFRFGNVQRTV